MSSEEEEYEVEIEEEEDEIPAAAPKALKKMMIQDNDPYNGTFIFIDEDHTLGNSLRFILSNHPNVEFCGYSLPHPSENKMNVRLQTVDKTKEEVMNEGLQTLQNICDIIEVKFKEAMHLD